MPEAEVCVAGGGMAGFAAALASASAGRDTLLLERYGFLGGAATASNVLSFCGLYQSGPDPLPATGGASTRLLAEMRALGIDTTPHRNPRSGNWIVLLEPEALKLAMDHCLAEAKVDVLHHATVVDAETEGKTISRARAAGPEGRIDIRAGAWVDATGNGHLASFALGQLPMPRQARLQPYSAPVRVSGIPDPASIDRDRLAEAIARYNETGAYPIHRPTGGFFAPIPGSDDIWWLIIDIPSETVSAADMTHAERYTREAAREYVALLRGSQDATRDAALVQTGPQVGIREAGAVETCNKILAQDLLNGRLRPDGVARAAWPMEDHSEIGKPTHIAVGGPGYAHIPIGALRVPGIKNLWLAGRTIGSDALAYTSIRVMGTAFSTGLAAGFGAAIPDAPTHSLQRRISEESGIDVTS